MKNCIQLMNRKGASSVLIILMMVVLTIFGLAALTTSMAASRLGAKSHDWTGEYYLLEAEAKKVLFDVDTLLFEAEKTAVGYIEDGRYMSKAKSDLPDEIQKIVYTKYRLTVPKNLMGDYLKKVCEVVFYNEATKLINSAYPQMKIEYKSGYLRRILEDEGHADIVLSMTVSEENKEIPKNIDVAIRLKAPSYNISLSDKDISGVRTGDATMRYNIIKWTEWQPSFDYSEKIEYDDPF